MKLTNKLFWLAIVLISFSFFFLRFNHYIESFNFAMDQGVHLTESKSIVDNKHLTLIGPSSSKIYQNKQFFTGPTYYYILASLGIITNWDPLIINAILVIIDFIFLLWFILWLQRKFGNIISITCFTIFTFSKYFIFHHTFFWNPHFIFSLSICAVIFLDKFVKTNHKKWLYLFSLFFGLAFSFHYTGIFWAIPAFIIIFKKINNIKIKDYFLMLLLFITGDLPFFIFEFRHEFYNLKTAFLAFIHPSDTGLTSHYFVFPLIIFLTYFIANILYKSKKQILLSAIILITFLLFNSIYKTSPPTFLYSSQQNVVNFIINDKCPTNFNISQTQTGDSRAYNLRFLLSRVKCHPNSVESYPSSQIIYLISNFNRPFETETIWEVTSDSKLSILQKDKIYPDLNIYKLGRQ